MVSLFFSEQESKWTADSLTGLNSNTDNMYIYSHFSLKQPKSIETNVSQWYCQLVSNVIIVNKVCHL